MLMINKSSNYMYKTVSSYCLKYRSIENIQNPKVFKIENGRIMILSKFALFNSKKLFKSNKQEDC